MIPLLVQVPGKAGVGFFVPFLYFLDHVPTLREGLYWGTYAFGYVVAAIGILTHWPQELHRKIFWKGFSLVIIASLYGAKLFSVFFEEPKYYWAHPLETLIFWERGTAFYGGLFLGFAVGTAFVWHQRISILRIYDLCFTWIFLAVAIGSLGCWFAGCCDGLPTTMPWGLARRFSGNGLFEIRHPTQLYQMVARLGVFYYVWRLSLKKLLPGQLICHGLGAFAFARLFTEIFRGDASRGFFIPGMLSYAQGISLAILFSVIAISIIRRHIPLFVRSHP